MPSSVAVAVLTDVHGNGFAAQAVAADIRRHAPDLIVNLGDQVWGQANPALAFAVQADLNAVEVRGNNEERLTFPDENLFAEQIQLRNWLWEHLPESELSRLANLPLTASLLDGRVLIMHGSPTSCWEGLLIADGPSGTPRQDAELHSMLADHPQPELILAGHMHRDLTRRVGGQTLVNVGSVTYRGDGEERAGWAMCRRTPSGWEVEFHRVNYDVRQAQQWVREHAAHLPGNMQYLTFP